MIADNITRATALHPTTTILIKDEPFGYGFDVEVVPPPLGVGHDREFRSHEAALSYASGLQKAMGWSVRDLSAEARG